MLLYILIYIQRKRGGIKDGHNDKNTDSSAGIPEEKAGCPESPRLHGQRVYSVPIGKGAW
jgi:hypothetical protein